MIDQQDDLDALVRRLADEPVLAVDCEMDSMYAYGTSLCVVQLGWPGGEALLDGLADLDRSGLGRLLADPDQVKVLHGGENDVGLLRDRWGLDFVNLFDTMAASQVLGHDGYGLAAVLKRHFDVHVSKKFQKADWRVRPLPEDQAEYARLDVRYLIPLRETLLAELEQLGRVEEAESEFARIAAASIPQKPFDPDNWARVKGARDLDRRDWPVLREVFIARDELARRMDRAPYRVMHDSALIALARHKPASEGAYKKLRGVNRRLGKRDVQRLLDAVAAGRESEPIKLPRKGGRRKPWESGEGKLTPEQEATFDALRRWRGKRADRRGVEVARVATTALLAAIAREQPTDSDALAAVDGVEPWRLREYGEEIVEVVRASRS